jgi:hypothetical protein
MYRLLTLSALILACVAPRAEGIEMFTNFHNGENVGFPPMQVPYGIYGGFGRGGWNPNAEGMPLKTWPPVPSMMPTGQIPGGFRRFNNGGSNQGSSNGKVNQDISNADTSNGFSPLLVSDRRHGRWQRGDSYAPEMNENGTQNGRTVNGADGKQNLEPTPAEPPVTTILHAQQGTRPVFQTDPKATSAATTD